MAKSIIFVLISFSFNFAFGENNPCHAELQTLKSLCSSQVLNKNTAHFSNCSTGFSYDYHQSVGDNHFTMKTAPALCKIIENRNEESLKSKTTYFESSSDKTVVYQHTNGLNNTFVYGATGFYHISETQNGDSLYDFHFYKN